VGELQDDLFGQGIAPIVVIVTVCRQTVKTVSVGMDEQPVLGTGDPHVVAAHQLRILGVVVSQKHVDIVELAPFGLVDGRYHHLGARNIAEILH